MVDDAVPIGKHPSTFRIICLHVIVTVLKSALMIETKVYSETSVTLYTISKASCTAKC